MVHPKNAVYVSKWRANNREKSIVQNKESMQRYYLKYKSYIQIAAIFRRILL